MYGVNYSVVHVPKTFFLNIYMFRQQLFFFSSCFSGNGPYLAFTISTIITHGVLYKSACQTPEKAQFLLCSSPKPYIFNQTRLFIRRFARLTNVSFISASICYWSAGVLCMNAAFLISRSKRTFRATANVSASTMWGILTRQIRWHRLIVMDSYP